MRLRNYLNNNLSNIIEMRKSLSNNPFASTLRQIYHENEEFRNECKKRATQRRSDINADPERKKAESIRRSVLNQSKKEPIEFIRLLFDPVHKRGRKPISSENGKFEFLKN